MDAEPTIVAEMIFPTHTNHYGTLFGGEALKLMDKTAFIAASRDVHKNVTTASIGRTDFRHPVRQGELIEVIARVVARGRTSLTIETEMYSENLHSGERKLCTVATFIMVAVDGDGKPVAIA